MTPPPGLPRVVQHRGITVCFAAKHETADELIAELIRAAFGPAAVGRRVERPRDSAGRAAPQGKGRRQRAWYAEMIRARRQREEASAEGPARPAVPLLEEDVNYWLRAVRRRVGVDGATGAARSRRRSRDEAIARKPFPPGNARKPDRPIDNPFPPATARISCANM